MHSKVEELQQELFQAEQQAKWEWMRDEIEHRAVYRVAPNGHKLPGKAPAMSYTWQFYTRRVLFDPKFVMTAAELLLMRISNHDVQIGACEDAGVPLGLAMSALLGQPLMTIKKSRKVYGLLNFTEGRITGKPILLVDDVAGSQRTLKSGVKILESFKLPVADEYATLINKTQGTHPESYLNQKRLVSLFTCDDFAMGWKAYVEKHKREPEFGPYY